jgi:Lrp/AsnC family leucine-responsive transcriptional regulator
VKLFLVDLSYLNEHTGKFFQMRASVMLEDHDRRLLSRLQKDSRQSNQQLADELHMSASACWRRVRALEEDGVITRYTALVDREKAGFATSAILHVSLDRHDAQFVTQFVTRVRRRAEVLECFATTGDADYHLRVVVEDMAAYNRFLDEFMFTLPGIRHVRTNMILKEIKYDVSLPL